MGFIKHLERNYKMGVYTHAVLMIGYMFNDNEIENYEDIEDEELDFSGNHMTGSYMCVGNIIAKSDSYGATQYESIDDVDYNYIKDKVEMKLRKIYPNKKLDVKIYLVTDIG
jgi:hypothetical protein